MASSNEQMFIVQRTPSDIDAAQSIEAGSQIYSMLPAAIKARLSPIRSLRRSLSDYSLRPRRETLVLHHGSESESTIPSQGSAENLAVAPAPIETSGSKYARHGFSLLQTSLAESQNSDPQSQAFSRQLYLNAVSYLLQGLPSDLNTQEIVHLQTALPNEIQELQLNQVNRLRGHPGPPSLLHRSLASSIVFLSLLFRLLLPYIRYFFAIAYRYERRYHISEKLLSVGLNTADSLGKKTIEFAGTAMGNELITGTVSYCVDGICGGLTEGLGEGKKVIEASD